MLLGYFRPHETLNDIYTWIESQLRSPIPVGWYVLVPPVKFTPEQRSSTCKQLSLLPSAMLIFKAPNDTSSNAFDLLKPEVLATRGTPLSIGLNAMRWDGPCSVP